jgi:hypothetical protein
MSQAKRSVPSANPPEVRLSRSMVKLSVMVAIIFNSITIASRSYPIIPYCYICIALLLGIR